MIKYFVMTDIHSFYTQMKEALNKNGFEEENKEHKLIVCGDLFDRGDESVEVFEFAKKLAQEDRLVYVKGNHEDLLIDCLNEIKSGKTPSLHHYHNGTVHTICTFCGYREEWKLLPKYANISDIMQCMKPVVDFINKYSVDYYELGNNIFVHGWLADNQNYKTATKEMWKEARWENGMSSWYLCKKLNLLPSEKTVYCGHWNCSFGNSHYHLDKHLKEFPTVRNEKFYQSFAPFIDSGIVALDSCCAYSGFLNCVTLQN